MKAHQACLLLETSFGGWSCIRQTVIKRLSDIGLRAQKKPAIQCLLNLFENNAPLAMTIYSTVYLDSIRRPSNDSAMPAFMHALQRIFVMFWIFKRRNYDKQPLRLLSQLIHVRTHGMTLWNTMCKHMKWIDDFFNEQVRYSL